jgi:hypothetical protein
MGRRKISGEYQVIVVFLVIILIMDQKFNISGGGNRNRQYPRPPGPPWY